MFEIVIMSLAPVEKYVDIRKVFADKNPRVASVLPGFIYRYLKRIIHQDEVNEFMRVHGTKTGIEFVRACLTDFNVRIQVEGLENVPQDGRYIFISNHPLGGFDGLMLMHTIFNRYGSVKVLVNDILMNLTNLHELFIPVNKHGRQHAELSASIDAAYASNEQLLTFPAGLVSRRIKGRIVDLAWQKSFIVKARAFDRAIVPVYVSGRCSNFFYNLAALRKFIGIKANVEMLYLADETFRHRNKEFTLTFGKPLPAHTFDKSRRPAAWASYVKHKVYQLGGMNSIPEL